MEFQRTQMGVDDCARHPIGRPVALVLELIIAAYVVALTLVLAVGRIDLGVISLSDGTKPILVLLLVVPLRFAINESSWFLELARSLKHRDLARRLEAVFSHITPAVKDATFALVATRVATLAIGFIANLIFTPHRTRAFAMPFRRDKLAELFAAWDSGWYFDIARRGYYFRVDGQSSVAFFPLYPMAMRALAWPFGGTERAIWLAGIILSCATFALALVSLHRLTEKIFGDREIARRTVLYFAIFPFSLFFSRVYAESLFLLTTVLAISRAYEGRWWRAGGWGALATLARPNGILIGLPLALLAMERRPSAHGLVTRLLPLLLVPAALTGYSAYVYSLSGDPMAWLSAQSHWGYSLGHPPWQQLLKMIGRIVKYGLYDYFFVSAMAPYRLLHGVVALIFLALTPAVFRWLGAAMGMYVLVSLLIPLSGNALEGVGRYSAVLFPVFMVVGRLKSPRVHEAILVVSSLFLALLVCLFATGRPVY